GVFVSRILLSAFPAASAALLPVLRSLPTTRSLFDTKAAERKRNPMQLCFVSTFSRRIHRDWCACARRNRCPSGFLSARQTQPFRGASSSLYRSILVRA